MAGWCFMHQACGLSPLPRSRRRRWCRRNAPSHDLQGLTATGAKINGRRSRLRLQRNRSVVGWQYRPADLPRAGIFQPPRRPGRRRGSARCRTGAIGSHSSRRFAFGNRGKTRARRRRQCGAASSVSPVLQASRGNQAHKVSSKGASAAVSLGRLSVSPCINRTDTSSRFSDISGTSPRPPSMRRRSSW